MARQSPLDMYRPGPSRNNPLDNILPQQKPDGTGCGPPAVGNLLSDLQSGLEWNICTTPNKDGGYCVKFSTNRPPCPPCPPRCKPLTTNKSQAMGPSRTHINHVRMTPSREVQQSTSKERAMLDMFYMTPEEAAQFGPSTAKDNHKEPTAAEKKPSERTVPTKTASHATAKTASFIAAKQASSSAIVSGKQEHKKVSPPHSVVEEEKSAFMEELLSAAEIDFTTLPMVDSQEQAELVAESLDSQRDSNRPAMLVCVLLGPSTDLMRISNTVQGMAKESGVTVRMNAPMH